MQTKETISFYLPALNSGGIGANTLRLSRELVKLGYKVDIVLATARGEYLEQVDSRINLIDLNSKRVLTSLPGLIKYLRSENPLCLISANDHSNLIAIIASRLTKTRIIASVRTHLSTHVKENGKLKEKIVAVLCKMIYPLSNHIVAVSQGVADDVLNKMKLSKDMVKVIYNPVYSQEISRRSEEKLNHLWYKHDRKYKLILSVGRLTKQKDYPTLLQAIKLVSKQIEVKLVILGEGEERENLQDLIKLYQLENIVDLVGFVENPYPFMKKSDLFVLSSAWEGFGNVLVETMATGTKVISTNCPSGPSEILDNGKYGSLVEVGDSEGLARVIIKELRVFHNPNEIKKQASKFSVETAAKEYLKLIKR